MNGREKNKEAQPKLSEMPMKETAPGIISKPLPRVAPEAIPKQNVNPWIPPGGHVMNRDMKVADVKPAPTKTGPGYDDKMGIKSPNANLTGYTKVG